MSGLFSALSTGCAPRGSRQHGFLPHVTEVETGLKSTYRNFYLLIINIKQCLHGLFLRSVPGRSLNYICNVSTQILKSHPLPHKPAELVNLLMQPISLGSFILLLDPEESQFLTRAASWKGREGLYQQTEFQLLFSSEHLQALEVFLWIISYCLFLEIRRYTLWGVWLICLIHLYVPSTLRRVSSREATQ